MDQKNLKRIQEHPSPAFPGVWEARLLPFAGNLSESLTISVGLRLKVKPDPAVKHHSTGDWWWWKDKDRLDS